MKILRPLDELFEEGTLHCNYVSIVLATINNIYSEISLYNC